MRDSSVRQLTVLGYYLLFIIGVAFSLAGVLTKAVAETFAVDAAVIGYRFTLFSVGYSVAILGNGFILHKVNIRKETLVASALAALAVAGVAFWTLLGSFSFFILLYGLAMGLLCSIGYHLVVSLHDATERAAKLNMLNFFFSAGSIIAPLLAGQALEHGIGWQTVMQATLVLLAAVVATVFFCRWSALRPGAEVAAREDDSRWNGKVYLMGLTLFCYVVSEMVFTYWIVLFMMERLSLHVALASMALSVFWVFMAVGRFLAGVFIGRVCLVSYILAGAGLAFISFTGLLRADNAAVALGFIALMGFGYSGLYATIMSYGTLQLSGPSSKLTTFYLTIGALAGIFSFLLSSYLKASFNVLTVMQLSLGLMGTVIVLAAVAALWRTRPRMPG